MFVDEFRRQTHFNDAMNMCIVYLNISTRHKQVQHWAGRVPGLLLQGLHHGHLLHVHVHQPGDDPSVRPSRRVAASHGDQRGVGRQVHQHLCRRHQRLPRSAPLSPRVQAVRDHIRLLKSRGRIASLGLQRRHRPTPPKVNS